MPSPRDRRTRTPYSTLPTLPRCSNPSTRSQVPSAHALYFYPLSYVCSTPHVLQFPIVNLTDVNTEYSTSLPVSIISNHFIKGLFKSNLSSALSLSLSPLEDMDLLSCGAILDHLSGR